MLPERGWRYYVITKPENALRVRDELSNIGKIWVAKGNAAKKLLDLEPYALHYVLGRERIIRANVPFADIPKLSERLTGLGRRKGLDEKTKAGLVAIARHTDSALALPSASDVREKVLFGATTLATSEEEQRLFEIMRDRLGGIAEIRRLRRLPEIPANFHEFLDKEATKALPDGSTITLHLDTARPADFEGIMHVERTCFGKEHQASEKQMRERIKFLPADMFTVARLITKTKEGKESARVVGYSYMVPTDRTKKTLKKLYGKSAVVDLFGSKGIFNIHGGSYFYGSLARLPETREYDLDVGGFLFHAAYLLAERHEPKFIFTRPVNLAGRNVDRKLGMVAGDEPDEMMIQFHSSLDRVNGPVLGVMDEIDNDTFPRRQNVGLEDSFFEVLHRQQGKLLRQVGVNNPSKEHMAKNALAHLSRAYNVGTIAKKLRVEAEQLALDYADRVNLRGIMAEPSHGKRAERLLRWAFRKLDAPALSD